MTTSSGPIGRHWATQSRPRHHPRARCPYCHTDGCCCWPAVLAARSSVGARCDENGRCGIVPGRPTFSVTLMTVLLPVVLMMGKALADIFALKGTAVRSILDFLGEPMFALLLTTLLAIFTFRHEPGRYERQCGGSAAPDR